MRQFETGVCLPYLKGSKLSEQCRDDAGDQMILIKSGRMELGRTSQVHIKTDLYAKYGRKPLI